MAEAPNSMNLRKSEAPSRKSLPRKCANSGPGTIFETKIEGTAERVEERLSARLARCRSGSEGVVASVLEVMREALGPAREDAMAAGLAKAAGHIGKAGG